MPARRHCTHSGDVFGNVSSSSDPFRRPHLSRSLDAPPAGIRLSRMARASTRLVAALRHTARRLSDASVTYRWSSFAHCNCGHLAQTITQLSPQEIQERALRREGDWGAQAGEFAWPRPDFGDRPALDEGAWEPEDVGACRATGAR